MMATGVFISAQEAVRRYCVADARTLKRWARNGYLLYQCVGNEHKQVWFFESPEARYERTVGLL